MLMYIADKLFLQYTFSQTLTFFALVDFICSLRNIRNKDRQWKEGINLLDNSRNRLKLRNVLFEKLLVGSRFVDFLHKHTHTHTHIHRHKYTLTDTDTPIPSHYTHILTHTHTYIQSQGKFTMSVFFYIFLHILLVASGYKGERRRGCGRWARGRWGEIEGGRLLSCPAPQSQLLGTNIWWDCCKAAELIITFLPRTKFLD